jgi:hypothetical protein
MPGFGAIGQFAIGQAAGPAGSANLSISLVGVSATGAVKAPTPSVAKGLTGVAATGSIGSPAPSIAKSLTGVAATGSVGTPTPSVAKSLTGVAATGSVGTPTPSVAVGLTGVAATGSVGTITGLGLVGPLLTGVAATGSVGTVRGSVAKTPTGVAATGSVGTPAASVAKSLTGVAATGTAGTLTAGVSVTLRGVKSRSAVGTIWPVNVPQLVNRQGYTERPERSVVSFQPENGPPIGERPRFSISSDVFQFTQPLSSAEFDSLMAFWRDGLDDGTQYFQWTHPRTQLPGTFKFTAAPEIVRAMRNDRYLVQSAIRLIPPAVANAA